MVGGSSYPRVLVVGPAFNRCCGGGVTLSNLFEGWPPDRLAAAVFHGQVMDRDVCPHYVLGSGETVWPWPLSMVPRRNTPSSGTDTPGPADGRAQSVGSAVSATRAAGLLYAGVNLLGIRDELQTLRMSGPLRAWIRAFAPDLIYAQLGDLPLMSLVGQISDEFGLPLALHTMDDWPSFRYRSGVLQGAVRGHMERKLRALMRRASSLMAISDAMATEYESRYGGTFLPIHNPVDLDLWDGLAAKAEGEPGLPSDDGLRVLYTGRCGLATADSIFDVAEAVSEMSSRGERITLQVNTRDADSPWSIRMAALPGVTVTSGCEYSRVPGLMAAADVLLLPLDFDEPSARLMRLSMPTKVSEYLASGRPVLTYAPRGSATAEYARAGGWSVVVDERDPAALRRALKALLSDNALRAGMGSRARRCAEERHDARRVRAQFKKALMEGAAAARASL